MKIRSMVVEAFRGYPGKYHFNFSNSDVILLYGPNGHGKTSLFDGIEWCLTGDLSRYESTQERKAARFLGNHFTNKIPFVQIVLEDGNGKLFTIRREGSRQSGTGSDYSAGSLTVELADGTSYKEEQAEQQLQKILIREGWLKKVSLSEGLRLTNILSQERMNALVRTMRDRDRYDSLSILFGTEHFNRYADELRTFKRQLQVDIDKSIDEIKVQEQLVETYSEQLSKYNGRKEFMDEAWESFASYATQFRRLPRPTEKDLSAAKLALHKDRVKLNREKSEAARWEENLLELYLELTNWLEDEKKYEETKQIRELFVTVEQFDKRIEDLHWLKARIKQYESYQTRLAELESESNVVQQQIQGHMNMADNLSKVINDAESLFQVTDIKTSEFQDWLHFADGSISQWDANPEIKSELINIARDWYENQIAFLLIQSQVSEVQQAVKGIQGDLSRLKGMDKKHQQFLRDVSDYVSDRVDLHVCPVCGTQGITSTKIAQYIEAQRTLISPELSFKEQKLANARHRLEGLIKERDQYNSNGEHILNQERELIKNLHGQLEHHKSTQWALNSKLLTNISEQEEQRKLAQLFETRLSRLEMKSSDVSVNHVDALLTEALESQQRVRTALGNEGYQSLSDVDEFIRRQGLRISHIRDGLLKMGITVDLSRIGDSIYIINERRNEVKAQIEFLEKVEHASLHVQALIEQAESYQTFFGLSQNLKGAEATRKEAMKRRTLLQQRSNELQQAIDAVPKTIKTMNERMMGELRDTVEEIYHRIGSHPVYSEISYRTHESYRANRLAITASTRDHDDEEVNPSFVFSTAQINAVSLAFFLAMSLNQRWCTLDTIAMDDPVQSMDDLNVVQLIDLLRVVCNRAHDGKQIIISTHDSSLYELMAKKFRNMNVKVFKFSNYTKAGPDIEEYLFTKYQYQHNGDPLEDPIEALHTLLMSIGNE